MSYITPPTSSLQSTEKISQGATSGEFQQQSSSSPAHIAPIYILDDDSLLNIFYLYRPLLLGEDKDDDTRLAGGDNGWIGEHWWFKLAHVCQRWRNLILGSCSYLGLCLVCINSMPIADMLAYSPPLPLIIEWLYEDSDIGTEDEAGLMLALEQRDRVRRIRLVVSVQNSEKLFTAINEEFPILEYLIITSSDRSFALVLPEGFQAPRLHQVVLIGSGLPIRSQLLTTTVDLVTLCLTVDDPSTYFFPNILHQWLSSTPRLEMLVIVFSFPVYNLDTERELMRTPITTQVTLPNLRWFAFQGVSAYTETLFPWISSPRLEKLQIFFFEQPTFSTPYLVQFLNTTRNLRFGSANFTFSDGQVDVEMYSRKGMDFAFRIGVICQHLDLQVLFITQMFGALSQIFSAVEHLALEHEEHIQSSEEHDAVDRSEWHKLFRSFSNVKTLRIDDGLSEQLSRCLQWDNGGLPWDLLPELQELTYAGNSNAGDIFTSFIDARQNAGRPVTLVRRNTPHSSVSAFEPAAIISVNGEAGNNINT